MTQSQKIKMLAMGADKLNDTQILNLLKEAMDCDPDDTRADVLYRLHYMAHMTEQAEDINGQLMQVSEKIGKIRFAL